MTVIENNHTVGIKHTRSMIVCFFLGNPLPINVQSVVAELAERRIKLEVAVTIADALIVAVSCAFAVMGVGSLWKPALVTRQFGIVSLSRAGRSEARAVYGGFGVVMALVLLLSLDNPAIRSGVCLTVAAALAGMACGRIVSMLADRGIDRAPGAYLILEAVAAAALLPAI